NKPWLDFTGRPLEEQLGDGWRDAVHPEDCAALIVDCSRAFSARRSFRTEFRLRRADGQYRWMLDTGSPRYTPDGDFVGFIGTCMDITEQKIAVETLRESEERFRDLADNI